MKHQHLSHIKKAIAPHQPESAIARSSTHPIEELQGAIGNRAVNQLLAKQPIVQAKPMFRGLSRELVIQRKLAIGAVGDKYEQEADLVAEQVVRQINAPKNSAIQHQEMLEENDAELQMKPTMQRLPDGNGIAAAPELASSIDRAKISGQPLAENIREPMEQAFGTNFKDVRTHNDAQSDALNKSIQSRAFTTGRDIFFRQGFFAPGSRGGQELLAHELTHVVQQAGSITQPQPSNLAGNTPKTSVDIIQRDVGFEFEIDQVKTYKKNFRKQPRDLAKKDEILNGEGFKLEADEMPNHSNMEFVTDAFPETDEGARKLVKALDDIDAIITLLTGQQNIEIPAGSLAAHGTPKENRYLMPTVNIQLEGKPQVTAGILLRGIDRLFSDIEYQPGKPNVNNNVNNNARILFGGQLIPKSAAPDTLANATGMPLVAAARTGANAALAHYNLLVQTNYDPNLVIGGPELRALITQLAMYLAWGAVGLGGYGKLISGEFLNRTDFATAFQLLPKRIKDYFTNFPDVFVDLVLESATPVAMAKYQTLSPTEKREQQSQAYKGGNLLKSSSVFQGGLYNDPGMYQGRREYKSNPLTHVSREAWLKGIVNQTDLLTAENYPGKKKHKEEIESLGSYGNATDNATPELATKTPAPIVEFRGFKTIYAHLFTPFALDLFSYIRNLNTFAANGYSGHLLDLSVNDRIDLINGAANAATIRKQIIDASLNTIDASELPLDF